MSNVWFTADTHFGHKAMVDKEDGSRGWRPFTTMLNHDEHLIREWNKLVRPADKVFHLGDVGMGTDTHVLECVRRLNGHKHLISGNHDAVWPGHRSYYDNQRKWMGEGLFESIQPFARRRVGKGESYLLSHFPYAGQGDRGPERYTQYRLVDGGLWLLHGHVHDAWSEVGCMINVGVDVRDWRPMALEEVMQIFRA